jgi:hypothetical protein
MTIHRLLQTLALDQDGVEWLLVAYEEALRLCDTSPPRL